MPRSLHMIKHYQQYNKQLNVDLDKSKKSKSKVHLPFFILLLCDFGVCILDATIRHDQLNSNAKKRKIYYLECRRVNLYIGSDSNEAYLILEGFVNLETSDGYRLSRLGIVKFSVKPRFC